MRVRKKQKTKTRIQKGSVVRGPKTLGASGSRYIASSKGNITKGPMNLGSAKNRYTASKKLAEEAKEATQKAMLKASKKKQGPDVEINPEKDIVGNGVQQSGY